jgi:predicted transcriptional regulator
MVYTFEATTDIEQLAVVKITGELQVATATADTDPVIGIALEGVKAGHNVPVQLLDGVLHGYAGATITAGDVLTPTAEGEVIPATTSGQHYWFIAITNANTDEEVQMFPRFGTVA